MTKLKSLLSLFLVLLLFLTGPTGVWAAEPPPSAQEQEAETEPLFPQQSQAVIELIELGLDTHSSEIRQLTQSLQPSEIEQIYYHKKKEPGIPMALNGMLAYGVGSFFWGDPTGGYIQFFGEIASALVFMILSITVSLSFELKSERDEVIRNHPAFWASMVGLFCFRIFGLIRPIFFVHGYNQDLQAALDYSPSREEAKPQESPPQAPQPELAPYLDSQGGGGLKFGWAF